MTYAPPATKDAMTEPIGSAALSARVDGPPYLWAGLVSLGALILYVATLPFALVGSFGWWTIGATAVIAYTFFGIEEIGVEIEDPFGYDDNDLPLERICATIEKNLREVLESAERGGR
jgi:predicted membrane chloride channel (bestrophin family)